ncbi:putative mitochondrial carrier domain superfamily [Helianthus anomalus]
MSADVIRRLHTFYFLKNKHLSFVCCVFGVGVSLKVTFLSSGIEVDSGRYKNTWKAFTTIISEQGWRQLFAGLGINYIKIVPSMAIGFATYDVMKLWLRIPPRQKTKSASTV